MRNSKDQELNGTQKELTLAFGPAATYSNVVVPHSRAAIEEVAGIFYDTVTALPGFEGLVAKVPRAVFVLWYFAALYSRLTVIAHKHRVSYVLPSGEVRLVTPPRTKMGVDFRSMKLPDFLHLVMGQFGPVKSEALGLTFWPFFDPASAPSDEDIRRLVGWQPNIDMFMASVSRLTPMSDSAPGLDQPGGWGSILVPAQARIMEQNLHDEMSLAAEEVRADMGKSVGSPIPAVRPGTPGTPGLTVESNPGFERPDVVSRVPEAPQGGGFVRDITVNVLGPSSEGKPIHAALAAMLNSASRPRGVVYGFEYGPSVRPHQMMASWLSSSVRLPTYIPIE